jgi:hypothetical protein
MMRTPFLAVLLAVFCSLAQAADFQIAPDRMAVVDGQRAFVLGLYEYPKEDAVLDEVAKAGFNLVYAGADTAALDRLQARGLRAWVNTGGAIDVDSGGDAALREMAGKYASHPALMVWEVPDEALWNCWHLASEWRRGAEPVQQRDKIAALTDKALAEKLTLERDRVSVLYAQGRPAEAEAAADAIWVALGEKQPHPDWSIATAQERSEKLAAGMVKGYKLLREIDSAHPVWMNHAPRNQISQLAMFNAGADIVGCDIYPVPKCTYVGHSDLMEQTAASVGAYTTRMQAAAPGKPVWMVLQGFGWNDIQPTATPERKKEQRRPTRAETQFMAYDTIVRGGRGILYWGTAYIEKDSQCWKDLLSVIAELSALQPVLSAPDAKLSLKTTITPTWGSVDREVLVLPKEVDGKTWLIVVNEWIDPVQYTIGGLDKLNGTTMADPASGVEATVENGKITLPIPAQSVQLLRPKM